ncbi:hypothetical protein LK994_14110 [Ferruginibacter lapsinanis]|uniref:right-handed parallel beta-helix repeat-containing protein n=1 Tax=Ferruginibacter lapsinanis TaxID=563172 RepID=UPI001E43BC46|nr:right-handed parallel beta-helix repeat-containing protein [Ferruginibacter lapsinanis]UEG49771.1 hypothetical protein LK994_14110 [Ferruginibacter lapsinanis]
MVKLSKYIAALLVLLLFSVSKGYPQKSECGAGYIEKNIVKDFGAKGDGITNDHAAFELAADYFNKRGGCGKLIIPFGLYKVGRQVVDTPRRFMNGADLLFFKNVTNLTVEGIPNKQGQSPLIKYADGLYYGSFYYDKQRFGIPKCTPASRNYDVKFAATIGGAISINSSSTVKIKHIELDGNMDNCIIGGAWGDVGRQLFHVGIYTNQGRDIELVDINVHHFALDGVENAGANKLRFENVVSSYNGRQGFSWVDGDTLTAINCKFNHTGRLYIYSAPSAGVDIEPERKKDISYAQFTNCEFAYNRGCGLLMAVGANTVRNMNFANCTFIGMYNWSAWIPGVDIHFSDCSFYGNVVHTVPNKMVQKVKDITSFKRCYFSDIYNGVVTRKPGGYFFPLNSEKIILDDCTMKIYNRGFFWHSSGCGPTDSLTSEIRNSVIYAANQNEWQASVTGIKITNTKLFTLPGKLNLACPKDYTNFERTSYTPEKMLAAFPESVSSLKLADTVSYFVCKEEKVLVKGSTGLKRRPSPEKYLMFYEDSNCVIANRTKNSITGTLYVYNDKQQLVATRKAITIKANYTKGVSLVLSTGKYVAKFVQKQITLASGHLIIP